MDNILRFFFQKSYQQTHFHLDILMSSFGLMAHFVLMLLAETLCPDRQADSTIYMCMCMDVQFFQSPLLKKTILFLLYFLSPFSKVSPLYLGVPILTLSVLKSVRFTSPTTLDKQ